MELKKYKRNRRGLHFVALVFLFLILAVNFFAIMYIEGDFEKRISDNRSEIISAARMKLESAMRDTLNNLRIERQAFYRIADKLTDNIYRDIIDRLQEGEVPAYILGQLSEASALHSFYHFSDGEVTVYSVGREEKYAETKDGFLALLEDLSPVRLFSITGQELIAVAVPPKENFQTEDGREVFLRPLDDGSFRFDMIKNTITFRKWEEISGGIEIDLEELPPDEGVFFEAINTDKNSYYSIYLYASDEFDCIVGVYGDLAYREEASEDIYALYQSIISRQYFAVLFFSVAVAAAMFFLLRHVDKTYLNKTFYLAKRLEEEKDVVRSEYKNLYNEVNHDVLTGIYNRGFTEVYLSDLFHNRGEFFSCIIGDIDDFKKVNDTYGHEAGDRVLKEISEIVTANLRVKDVFARWGGEEFLIVIKFLDLDEVARIAERIKDDIEKNSFRHKGFIMKITISFGISCFKEEDKDYTDIIIRADKALYRSKALGKNMITVDV